MCRSSSAENARGRSVSMNFRMPRQVSSADLDEDAGALLDVVARGLDQARHLAQLRHDAPGALGLGRVGKQRLAGQAGADGVRVDLRVPLPASRTVSKSNIRASMLAPTIGCSTCSMRGEMRASI